MDSKDEIAQLGNSFNKMIESLGVLYPGTFNVAEKVVTTGEELSGALEEVTASSEQISGTLTEVSVSPINKQNPYWNQKKVWKVLPEELMMQ